MSSVALGISAGLLSGACMSFSYLLSRHHAVKRPSADRGAASLGLLLRSHVLMGIVCAPLAAWLAPDRLPAASTYLPAVVSAASLYLLGNVLLFALLRHLEASRLTPFLGLKIFFLALIVAVVVGDPLSGRQWAAVIISMAATALLQGTSGGLPRGPFVRILLVCLCFALADLCIVRLIDALDPAGPGTTARLRAAVFAMLLNYLACGLACGICLAVGRPRVCAATTDDWIMAGWYAGAWLLAMASLYICFALVGAVLGNVVQSTRGIMSIVIGAALADLGWHELEQRVDRAALVRRIGAAALMTAAIAVYAL